MAIDSFRIIYLSRYARKQNSLFLLIAPQYRLDLRFAEMVVIPESLFFEHASQRHGCALE